MSEIIESDELRLARYSVFWRDDTEKGWLCNNILRELFEIPDKSTIRLFSVSTPKPETYVISLRAYDGNTWLILPDISQDHIEILPALYCWLKQQIAQGRPHIGVYIIH